MFIDTTRDSRGLGTFNEPYNYIPVDLGDTKELFITATSVLQPLILKDPKYKGMRITGYDPELNTEMWEDVSEILDNPGPIFDGGMISESCIDVSKLIDDEEDTVLYLKNLRLYNWKTDPIAGMSSGRVEHDNVDMNSPQYPSGWKRITVVVD